MREPVDGQLVPGGPPVLIERERADDRPPRPVGKRRLGGEPLFPAESGLDSANPFVKPRSASTG
jgi:hypothetical protein